MARPTQCRRVAQRQAQGPSQAAVWISDLMLREAVEQYHQHSMVTKRSLSSSKGPFNPLRRPPGKRHMAGMMASPPPFRPAWWFELVGNRYAWKWQSPTTPQHRRDKEETVTLSGLKEKLIKWLEASDFDKPFLDPPLEAAAPGQIARVAQDTVAAASPHDSSLMKVVSDLVTAIHGIGVVGEEQLDGLLGQTNRTLRSKLHSGDFTTEQIYAILEPLGRAVLGPQVLPSQIRSINRFIKGNVVSTIAGLRRHNCGKLYEDAWTVIVDRTFSLKPGRSKFRLFNHMLHQASPVDVQTIDNSLYADMIRDFVYFHGDTLRGRFLQRAWIARTLRFSDAVGRLPLAKLDEICRDIHPDIWAADGTREHRFTWLILRVQMCSSTAEEMLQLVSEYKGAHGHMNSFEVRSLAMAHLVSQGLMDLQTANSLAAMDRKDWFANWSILAETAMDLGGIESLKGLAEWLRLTGEASSLMRGIVTTQLRSESHALRLCSRRVMEKMAEDPDLSAMSLRLEVDFVWRQLSRDMPRAEAAKMQRRMTELVEWLASVYIRSPELTDRQALRGVGWCLDRYERCNGHGSTKILSMVIKVVIRDLDAGRWGRTSRLKWLIDKTKAYRGGREAAKMARSLEKWRDMISEKDRYG